MDNSIISSQVEKIVNESINLKVFPGCVVGIVSEKGERIVLPFGRFTYDASSKNVSTDTIFDVASVTKVIPTSSFAHLFLERGKIALDTKLVEYVPEYHGDFREEITLFHLLTQTLPFILQLSLFKHATAQEILYAIFSARLRKKPGIQYDYNNTTSILLGMLLERVSGKKLDVIAREEFFAKLGMNNTLFKLSEKQRGEIPPTEIVDGREVQGIVHDESARVLSKIMTPGSAGLFSTASDLLLFLEMILRGGSPLFTSSTIEKMFTPVTLPDGNRVGLGWEMNQSWMGANHSEMTVGKTGFTGCMILVDQEKGIGIVLLSNHVYPQRREDRRQTMHSLRATVSDCILSKVN